MILVTGAKGQLGFDVCRELDARGINNRGVDINDFNITDKKQVKVAFDWLQPDAVIHCAAYTAVDKAEEQRELCYSINVDGTRNLAEACKNFDAKMLYISTDYVFDGSGDKPFEVYDRKNPINYYGYTKSLGEDAVIDNLVQSFIVRISWVFGSNGSNFVKTMMKLGRERSKLNVVNDQIGSPTYTIDLAVLLCDIILSEKYDIYHATNEGYCSWYDFASSVMKASGINCMIEGISTSEYPTKATRPQNSRLSKKSLDSVGFSRLRGWELAIEEYINNCTYQVA